MQRIKIVSKLLLLVLVIYLLLRIVFGMAYFGWSFSFSGILNIVYWGARMDIAAIVYINIPFLIYYFLLASFLPLLWQQRLAILFFSLINLPFIALNFIDLVYFRYTLRRSTIDIFYVFDDSIHSFGALLSQYWYMLLIFIIVAVLFVYAVRSVIRSQGPATGKRYIHWLAPLVFTAFLLLIARGWDHRPIVPSTPILYTEPVAQPLVNNSTLNLLYSCLRASSALERKHYFTDQQLDSLYTIRRQYQPVPGSFGEKRNVVIFVLESVAADFITGRTGKAKTPFFDSLLNHSIVCENAFANGHESVKGLTAILGSMPPFTDEPIFLSNYNSVPFNGLGAILKKEGYNTSFFHGAEYDHFNFAKLCRMAGIDEYYSKDTYGHAEHDDGSWGIYDEYFFSYFADVVAKKQQPFLSVLFNTSSHPPFTLPSERRDQFNIPGQSVQLNSITYVDDCFRELFDRIRSQPWFSNTLFVFCADHTLLENIDSKSYHYEAYHIPLFMYDPQHPARSVITRTVQQLDIVPSILHKLGYTKPFMSFGNDFLSGETEGFSIARKNDGYQLIDSATITCFDDQSGKTLYHYNYRTDSTLSKNIPDDTAAKIKTSFIKAIIQRFNNSLIDQKLKY